MESGFTIHYNEPIARHCNLKIGGPADLFALPETGAQVAALRRFAQAEGMEFRVLGGGTNLLAPDEGIRGVVVKLHPKAFSTFKLLEGNRVEVGGAFGFQELVHRVGKLGLSGFEKLTGIPGSIGGALRMNAGGKYREIGELVESVRAVVGEEIVEIPREQCGFRYRDSALKQHIVLSGIFQLTPGDRVQILKETREFAMYKASVQPLNLPSAGCVFSNPAAGSAGQLIDKAGLKGVRVGGACVSTKHGNFLYNENHASCADFKALVELIQDRVFQMFGVELQMEVQTWGCPTPVATKPRIAA